MIGANDHKAPPGINYGAVDVALLFRSVSVPKFVLILVVYVLGMLSGWGLVELIKAVF